MSVLTSKESIVLFLMYFPSNCGCMASAQVGFCGGLNTEYGKSLVYTVVLRNYRGNGSFDLNTVQSPSESIGTARSDLWFWFCFHFCISSSRCDGRPPNAFCRSLLQLVFVLPAFSRQSHLHKVKCCSGGFRSGD